MVLDFILYLILFPLLQCIGIYFGARFARHHLIKNEIWKPVGIENGLISIFALVLSFSLFNAGNHSKERETFIHQEADALSLLMRKSKFYEPVLQREVKNYMTGIYTIQLKHLNPEPKETLELISLVEKQDSTTDEFLKSYLKTNKNELPKINELIQLFENLGDKYVYLLFSYDEASPRLITVLLIVLSLFVSFLIGFMNRIQENKHHITLVLFILIITIMVYAIHDLDTPSRGFIKPDYSDILNTRSLMHRYYK